MSKYSNLIRVRQYAITVQGYGYGCFQGNGFSAQKGDSTSSAQTIDISTPSLFHEKYHGIFGWLR